MRRVILVVGVLVIAAVGVVAGVELFAPERATQVTDDAATADDLTVLRSGTFEGKAGHDVSGRVELVERDGTYYLRFVDYEQTRGPDVFVYLTPDADPDTTAEVGAGVKVLIDGGADGGESTKEGTFLQELPADLDPDEYSGVGIWCDRFSTPFGAAALR
jgi:hypothetical protein